MVPTPTHLPWLEQIHAMMNNYDRDYHEELPLNSGGSVTKTIHNIDVDATPEQIKDIVLCSHSNLKTPSQRLHAHNSIQQNQTKDCRLIKADMSHIFTLHIQTSQSMTLAQEHSVSTTLVHCMANYTMRWRVGSTKTCQNLYRHPSRKQ